VTRNPEIYLDEWTFRLALTPRALEYVISSAEAGNEHVESIHRASFTCYDCTRASVCTLAFDSYNTQGDCLWSK
jgi:hypothetical protein